MERREEIRKELLFQFYALRPLSRDLTDVMRECAKRRLDFTKSEISSELQFLSDEGLLIEINEPGTTCRRWRIHAQGVRHYEQNYAA